MDESFHYQLMVVHTLFQDRAMQILDNADLSPGQPKVLDYLNNHDGSMQKEIAFACHIDPATITGILNRMEAKGLIKRQIQPDNRRAFNIYLTNLGRKKCDLVAKTFSHLEHFIFSGISKQEQLQFMNTLYKLCSNLTDERGLP
ncbi:MAG: MarR family winged helix-turn-helix transcriptional regulator [Lawsonibacter sp.]